VSPLLGKKIHSAICCQEPLLGVWSITNHTINIEPLINTCDMTFNQFIYQFIYLVFLSDYQIKVFQIFPVGTMR
jgi:hypothetical protein